MEYALALHINMQCMLLAVRTSRGLMFDNFLVGRATPSMSPDVDVDLRPMRLFRLCCAEYYDCANCRVAVINDDL